jgi:hypothetical protein
LQRLSAEMSSGGSTGEPLPRGGESAIVVDATDVVRWPRAGSHANRRPVFRRLTGTCGRGQRLPHEHAEGNGWATTS